MRVHSWFKGLPLIVLAALATAGCEPAANFTTAPMLGYVDPSARARTTVIHAAVPLDPMALSLAGVASVPASTPTRRRRNAFVTWLRYGGCVARGKSRRCFGARVDGRLKRAGAPKISVSATGAVEVAIPVAFRLSARGLRRGRADRSAASGQTAIVVAFPIEIGRDLSPKLGARGAPKIQGSDTTLYGRAFDMGPHVGKWVGTQLPEIKTQLEEALGRLPIADATRKVWAQLQRPTPFGLGDKRWLTATPIRVIGADVMKRDAEIYFRTAIEADIRVMTGSMPEPGPIQVLTPELIKLTSADSPTPNQTNVPVAIGLPMDGLKHNLAKAFPDGTKIVSQRDSVTAPFALRLDGIHVNAAQRFVAISFDAEVLSPKRFAGRTGRINLVARPELDPASGTLKLTGVSFPVISAPTASRPDPEIKLSASPFAERIGQLGTLAFKTRVDQLRAQIATLFKGDVTPELRFVSALRPKRFDTVVLSPDGLDLGVELEGALMMVYRPTIQQSAAPKQHASSDLAGPATASTAQ
ncbi:MAG: DUF4403 family protein [Pseudomonadota bacterium]